MQKYDFTDKAEQDLEKIVNYTPLLSVYYTPAWTLQNI